MSYIIRGGQIVAVTGGDLCSGVKVRYSMARTPTNDPINPSALVGAMDGRISNAASWDKVWQRMPGCQQRYAEAVGDNCFFIT